MTFRRQENAQDIWRATVRENSALLSEVPAEALSSEEAFRGYVTNGVYGASRLSPPVSALSPKALEDLWTFINVKAQFDMDATLFDNFNAAFARKGR
jgi:hypothetical protein